MPALAPASFKDRVWSLFARTSGVYSSGRGLIATDEGLGGILFSALMGAFLGLLVGIILMHLVRYVAFLAGRHYGAYAWTIYCALLGGVLFGCLAAAKEED